MNRMTQLHIQYLNGIIEAGSKYADEAKQELAIIKAELLAQGLVAV